MDRARRRILHLAGQSAFLLIPLGIAGCASQSQQGYQIVHTDAEWSKILTHGQYLVLRQRATEPAFSSPLDHEKRDGVYDCAGCDQPVFSSRTKFDSHTGWPSFWAAIDKATDTNRDTTFGMVRDAVECHRCGGHLGHVFDDGPKPTGLRYCMNGVAMTFKPA